MKRILFFVVFLPAFSFGMDKPLERPQNPVAKNFNEKPQSPLARVKNKSKWDPKYFGPDTRKTKKKKIITN